MQLCGCCIIEQRLVDESYCCSSLITVLLVLKLKHMNGYLHDCRRACVHGGIYGRVYTRMRASMFVNRQVPLIY